MRIYGLTGGIGSGKSAAAARFSHHGIPVIDADHVGHHMLEPGSPVHDAVVKAFGDGILVNQQIDRVKLGALVFSDESARQRLNAIIHPAIRMEIARRCAANAEAKHPMTIIDAALIGEGGVRDSYLDGLIVVTCAEDVRVQRLVASRGLTEAEVRKRMAAQTPPEHKLAIADWVIDNTGTLVQLEQRVDEIVRELKSHAGKAG